MYTQKDCSFYELPFDDATEGNSLSKEQEVSVTGKTDNAYYEVNLNGVVSYVSESLLRDSKPVEMKTATSSQASIDIDAQIYGEMGGTDEEIQQVAIELFGGGASPTMKISERAGTTGYVATGGGKAY